MRSRLYDRHHRVLLGFCRHMLGSREEAEDALQQTFLRAHRALAERGAPAELRPWLFTIARNCSFTMLSARRPPPAGRWSTARWEVSTAEGLGEQVQVRADLQALVVDVSRLPDEQRAALVLAEVGDLSHDQIAEVIGVRPGNVKALIHQARTTLIAEREARETPCEVIREQLATAQGGAGRCAAIWGAASRAARTAWRWPTSGARWRSRSPSRRASGSRRRSSPARRRPAARARSPR